MPCDPPRLVLPGYNTVLDQRHREARAWVHGASNQKGVGEWTIQAAGYSRAGLCDARRAEAGHGPGCHATTGALALRPQQARPTGSLRHQKPLKSQSVTLQLLNHVVQNPA